MLQFRVIKFLLPVMFWSALKWFLLPLMQNRRLHTSSVACVLYMAKPLHSGEGVFTLPTSLLRLHTVTDMAMIMAMIHRFVQSMSDTIWKEKLLSPVTCKHQKWKENNFSIFSCMANTPKLQGKVYCCWYEAGLKFHTHDAQRRWQLVWNHAETYSYDNW